jgi:hypothetical protein
MTTYFSFKVGMLVFWGLWYGIAFSTNLCEIFRALKVLPSMWPFASGNLRDVAQATKTYSAGGWLSRLLFLGVLCFQLLIVLLFGWAVISSITSRAMDAEAINAAFSASLGLWTAFMLADEIFKQYGTEHAHVLFFIAQLVTLIALHALPV